MKKIILTIISALILTSILFTFGVVLVSIFTNEVNSKAVLFSFIIYLVGFILFFSLKPNLKAQFISNKESENLYEKRLEEISYIIIEKRKFSDRLEQLLNVEYSPEELANAIYYEIEMLEREFDQLQAKIKGNHEVWDGGDTVLK